MTAAAESELEREPEWVCCPGCGTLVFDKRYELAADFNTPRANGFVGVRWNY